ncbi:DsbE family thiol:disulfide interchange protein [Micavibrio aeruginosavorus]|uniref:DsbE family thiol:disulfide interchange protein n=1 Tax=Micavibrio aeruginosavorus TaxID=349221 RepID=UPI003F4ABCEA
MITRTQRLYFLLPLAFLGFLIALAIVPLLKGTDPSKLDSALIGQQAPAYTADGFDPAIVDTIFRGPGPVRVVNFFASWCPPCEAEHPMLESIAMIDNVMVIGINVRDLPQKREAFLARLGNPFDTILNDPDGGLSIAWGTSGTPETFIIDMGGIIRHRITGPIQQADIDGLILPLVQKGNAP